MAGDHMRISTERLANEAEATGFRPEMLEKVIHLLGLLEDLSRHPYLHGRLALKGGTALNLFVFDVPRLSVDVDLNYIAAADLETMRKERPRVEEALQAVLARRGYRVRRAPSDHAGGKWHLTYPSAIGQDANLEVDLNYMLRVPLWPIGTADSNQVGSYAARGVQLLDIHELASGKLAALFARCSPRDLFDAHQLLTQGGLVPPQLRLGFVIYGAMNRRDWRTVRPEDVILDQGGFQNQLVPLLRRAARTTGGGAAGLRDKLVDEVRYHARALLPFSAGEAEFLDRLLDHGEVTPSLLTDNEPLADRILQHPMLRWKALNVRQHGSR
jgi:predicted nucleotidyltransferase component of viral defense system